MLTELHVRNFAIIEDLHLVFHPGFNVLTGETGAGKSIIIDAIDLLLGGKSSQEMVRAGQSSARVEGIFDLTDELAADIQAWLQQRQLDDEGDCVILAREVRRGGRSVARINGRAVAQTLLSEIGNRLVDIHGQGQHLSLLRPRTHIQLLDQYAGLLAQRATLANQVAALKKVRSELAHLRQNARELARRLDLLRYQVQEIDEAGLAPDEEMHLQSELRRLANAEGLMSEAAALEILLSEGGAESPSALDILGNVMQHLEKIARLDPDLTAWLSRAEMLFEGISDLARDSAAYGSSLEFDPNRLAEVEDRMALIAQLKRKYGDTIAEILAFGENARKELAILSDSETRTDALESQEIELLHVIGNQARALSGARQKAAQRLASAVDAELETLRMGGTRFQIEITQRPDPDGCYVDDQRLAFDATGIDRLQFLVSTNPGEPMRPLARVASGGETARLMLAIKNVLSEADRTPTLIFDEIDQGIGGRVGAVVGQKLLSLAQAHQVVCVTHLPQIAAYADQHLQVTKIMAADRTISQLGTLEGEDRVQELAAMLGADTAAGRKSAQELLASAEAFRRTQT
ncbi:MAG: DNA repair protein RecN [Clostridia bacterium]|nr:MAG: DNA repair protein RecN [Clostridia bacterium]